MTLYRNTLMISLDNRFCDYPVLSVHGAPKTVYQTHATTSVSTTKIRFYYDKTMVNRKGIAKQKKSQNSMIEITSYLSNEL